MRPRLVRRRRPFPRPYPPPNRALFDRFNITCLATTDAALDPLDHHTALKSSTWPGRVIPTFRPDDLLNPATPGLPDRLDRLAGEHLTTVQSFLAAIAQRRATFGATATDHAIADLKTGWLPATDLDTLYRKARRSTLTDKEAQAFYGHMLIEMAKLSAEDGMVMQFHAGSRRNTNLSLFDRFDPDIPIATNWVDGLGPLLNEAGNDPRFRLILLTLDESTYTRELAPMVGHWPALRIGPPWWFHDSCDATEIMHKVGLIGMKRDKTG